MVCLQIYDLIDSLFADKRKIGGFHLACVGQASLIPLFHSLFAMEQNGQPKCKAYEPEEV